MNLRRDIPATLLALVLSTASAARAADYADTLDGFSVSIDPSGFVACTTFPVNQWDRSDCEGLNQEFEAGMRAQAPRDVVLLGSAVHRSNTWGFRVNVTRTDWSAPPASAAEDARLVESVRARVLAELADKKVVLGPGGVDVRMEQLGEVNAVRVSYEAPQAEAPSSIVELGVIGEHAAYNIEFQGARGHAPELDAIAERALRSVRIRPTPRRWSGIQIAIEVGAFAVAGTVALLLSLAKSRRRQRTSAVSWPGLRR